MAKRPRSEAQRAASRANGRRSTGPRTPAGKSRSRRNALKHGLRAASVELVARSVGDPSLTLAAAVHERLAPRDVIETELADGIAMALWRLRRAQQLEEALLAGNRRPSQDDELTGAFLRRSAGTGALALLLRYRSQALGELNRLFRLFEAHRETGAPTVASADHALPPTDGASG
jgi:hypothetical protein